jgi:hypothetical protein
VIVSAFLRAHEKEDLMKTRTLIFMTLAAALTRLIPHPWNFTAIGAMALFGGTYFDSKKQSLIVPLAALLISDLILGFHSTMLFVYGAVALIGILGWNLREEKSVAKVATLTLTSSLVFFVVSNFGVWMMDAMYAKTALGLWTCFVAAIPFFTYQVLGDFFFVGLMFGTFETLKKIVPALAKNNV